MQLEITAEGSVGVQHKLDYFANPGVFPEAVWVAFLLFVFF